MHLGAWFFENRLSRILLRALRAIWLSTAIIDEFPIMSTAGAGFFLYHHGFTMYIYYYTYVNLENAVRDRFSKRRKRAFRPFEICHNNTHSRAGYIYIISYIIYTHNSGVHYCLYMYDAWICILVYNIFYDGFDFANL